MFTFPCTHCRSPVYTETRTDQSIICPHCNTRQDVPATAHFLEQLPAAASPPASPPPFHRLRFFHILFLLVSILATVGGLILTFIGIHLAFWHPNDPTLLFAGLALLLSALLHYGFSHLFKTVRQIAQQTSHP